MEEEKNKKSAVEDIREKERTEEAEHGEDKKEGRGFENMELEDSTRGKEAVSSCKGEMFAGVGEFVAAGKEKEVDVPIPRLRDLDMRCVKEAALRYCKSM